MELLSIGIGERYKEVEKIFNEQLKYINREGVHIKIETNNVGDMIFLKYEIDDDNVVYKNTKKIFIHYIANVIADIIIEIYQDKILNRIISENYFYFSKEEKEAIKQRGLAKLQTKEQIVSGGITYQINRKARILKFLIDYLENNNEIIIEGFMDFRLKFYINTVEDILDKAAEEIALEREYNEFIKILQYFVNIQESKVNLVNVVIKENNYLLFDENGVKIDNDFFEEIADEIEESDINRDDILISTLITIAPKKIVVHGDQREGKKINNIVKIIERVFENRVSICEGCKWCNIKNKKDVKNREK